MSAWDTEKTASNVARWALGAWIPTAKLASKAYVMGPAWRRRLQYMTPFWYVLKFPALNPSANGEASVMFTNQFWLMAIMGSSYRAGGEAGPAVVDQNFNLQLYDAGKKQRLAEFVEPAASIVGSAIHPFYLRRPYRFSPETQLSARAQNGDAVNSRIVQVVLYGVTE
jgi:hypothetical protein